MRWHTVRLSLFLRWLDMNRFLLANAMLVVLLPAYSPTMAQEKVLEAIQSGGQNTASDGLAVDSDSLLKHIQDVREDLKLVAVGATVLVDGKVVAEAVTGKRHHGKQTLAQIDDRWHHGSITKSITATVLAKLVEEKKLTYDATVFELLPELKEQCHEEWASLTVHHLLTHQSGLPANFPIKVKLTWPRSEAATRTARKASIIDLMKSPPEELPGERYQYSNVGYSAVGMIAEELSDQTWEDLVRQFVFQPLKLESAGFGAPVAGAELSQPWGHSRVAFLRQPMNPATRADNTPIMGPAGIVHMSMADLAKYGWSHLSPELNESQPDEGASENSKQTALPRLPLSDESILRLHQPAKRSYAYGWICREQEKLDGKILWHNGSNTMWYSSLMLIPSRSAVIVFVTNDGLIEEASVRFRDLSYQLAADLPKRTP